MKRIIPAALCMLLASCQSENVRENKYQLKSNLLERKLVLTDSMVNFEKIEAYYECRRNIVLAYKDSMMLSETSLFESTFRYRRLAGSLRLQIKKLQNSLDSLKN